MGDRQSESAAASLHRNRSPTTRLWGRSFRTAMPSAFFRPVITSNLLALHDSCGDQVPLQKHVVLKVVSGITTAGNSEPRNLCIALVSLTLGAALFSLWFDRCRDASA